MQRAGLVLRPAFATCCDRWRHGGIGPPMDISSLLHLTPEAKIRFPNVDEALNIGYAIHSADDPALKSKIAQQNAAIVVEFGMSFQIPSPR